eukprot:TRINITY_DN10681_c0_g2_i1.p1 TRINITY_DN10681_c0_g2~~TRINITY_DN10681_c0_g2_i1.p1  ORF type:complete len:546 (+),score=102.55 TRINITY_DN10681_c0_g2_i1:121-1638(+)
MVFATPSPSKDAADKEEVLSEAGSKSHARGKLASMLKQYSLQRQYQQLSLGGEPLSGAGLGGAASQSHLALLEYGLTPITRRGREDALDVGRTGGVASSSLSPGEGVKPRAKTGGVISLSSTTPHLDENVPKTLVDALERRCLAPVPTNNASEEKIMRLLRGKWHQGAYGGPLGGEREGVNEEKEEEVAGRASARASKEAHLRQIAALQRQVDTWHAHVSSAEEQRQELSLREEAARRELQEKILERRQMEQRQENLTAELAVLGVTSELPRVLSLLEHRETLKERMDTLSSAHDLEETELQEEVRQLVDRLHDVAFAAERQAESEAVYKEELLTWRAARAARGRQLQIVARLRWELEEIPSQTELVQYERRFSELYEHVQKKHSETQRHYATYNSLMDAHKLTLKELSLCDSIHTQFVSAMASSNGRAGFLESMERLAEGVKQNVARADARLASERERCEEKKARVAEATAKERAYFAAVTEFQNACAAGETLREAIQVQGQLA